MKLLAEFAGPDALLHAARALREEGLVRMEAFTPYALPELEETLQRRRSRIPLHCLLGGIAGGLLALFFQWFLNARLYPLNVGGRPLRSIPAWIPITFELTVLFAALGAFVGLLASCGLPRLWHPLFDVPGFHRASIDRFFLAIDEADGRFDPSRHLALLEHFGALRALRVPG